MKTNTIIRFAAALLLGAASVAGFAAQRTFVASYGLDANPCTLASPCRTFTQAMLNTDANGEIIVLDSAGYGAFTITKSVSVIAQDGIYAGISVFQNAGITVNVGVNDKVVLRGLTINGQGGGWGIDVWNGGALHIERCVISNMVDHGVRIMVSGGTTYVSQSVVRSNRLDGIEKRSIGDLFVSDTRIAENGGSGITAILGDVYIDRVQVVGNGSHGINVTPLTFQTVRIALRDSELAGNASHGIRIFPENSGEQGHVTVERSSARDNVGAGFALDTAGIGIGRLIIRRSDSSGNGTGILVNGSGAAVWVGDSTVTRNGTGLVQSSMAVLNSCGNNMVRTNTIATSGDISSAPCIQ